MKVWPIETMSYNNIKYIYGLALTYKDTLFVNKGRIRTLVFGNSTKYANANVKNGAPCA